jgi:hypothetical protein
MKEKPLATGRNRAEREARQRARVYEARTRLHEAQITRRRRDNIIATTVAAGVIALAVAGQALFYTVGPGTPQPSEAPASTQAPAPSGPEAPLLPESTPAPSSSPSPTPSSAE